MYSPNELQAQREAVLLKKIEYLREEALLVEMTITDMTLRANMLADIRATIKRAGMELGGRPESESRKHLSETGSAVIVTEGEGGC